MVGAGVFVVFREAYAITPGGYMLALALGALVAALNAASVYSLASEIERAGGIYSYSRVFVGKKTSFVAGTSFVLGKIGSIAAIALVFAEYLGNGNKLLAVSAIVCLALVNIAGINRTATVAAVIATLSLAFLTAVWVFAFSAPNAQETNMVVNAAGQNFDLWHVLQATSIFFFAFAGYARVATLGNEVKNPTRNIPRAILISLGTVTVLYFALGWQLQRVFSRGLSSLHQPVAQLAAQTMPWLPRWTVSLLVSLAALGSMLALLAGTSRTAATMAEDRETLSIFALRNKNGSPIWAELAIAALACCLVYMPNLDWVIGFSSFYVLVYYAIGHVSAVKQNKQPKTVAYLGLLLCSAVALCVPGPAMLVGSLLLLLALGFRRLLAV